MAHRNFLRFLWWENGDSEARPTEYRMNVHLFGALSSPGCANFGLKRIASDNEAKYGSTVVRFVHRNFYVDDGLKSVSSPSEAIDLIKKSQDICAEGGVHLHKFVSNSKEVMQSVAPEELATGVQDLNLVKTSIPVEQASGVQWCIELDQFSFRITLKDQPLTRRGILSTVNSVYDPLGFLAPVILAGKLILQELCKNQYDWDSDLPESLRPQWEKWRSSLLVLDALRISRCYKPNNFGQVKQVELHHFSDASTSGYGQCSYLRVMNDKDEVHCSFVMGKSRVAPLKMMTAALVSVRISSFLQEELEYENVKEIFWSDSTVVLGFIANESRRFQVFVANRVQQIRNHTDPSQWFHVKSEDNPADEASRGMSADEFLQDSKWISGPRFLWESDISNYQEVPTTKVQSQDPELRKVHGDSNFAFGF